MGLTAGTRLGPYEILAALGAGGMGEVYRATDTNLGRQVAIKVLPAGFAEDPERVARFEREAKTLASLNHPNIAIIHGLEKSHGTNALVMELVEGEDLSQRIARGRIPLDEALPIAKQIAEALEAAHEQGIVHRDLKPANIKLRDDGTVKVLDFGLAKLAESPVGTAAGPSPLSMSPTITSPAMMTGVGVLLGTAAYMSPEQAKGRPADKRSDIWAFGCVVYEVLTGTKAFHGSDVAEVLAGILKSSPDLKALPATTPASITRMLRRCFEKDRARRLDSASAAGLDIADAMSAGLEPGEPGTRHGKSFSMMAGLAVVTIAALAGFAAVFLRAPSPRAREPLRLSAILPDDLVFNSNSVPALSPNGRKLVFSATSSDGKRFLWIRDLDSSTSRVLSGTDGANYPFWSPDNRFVAFFVDGKLKKINVNAGGPITLCDAPNSYIGSWSSEDVIVFTPNFTSGLARVSAAGGVPTPITELNANAGEISHRYPWFLPDGRHFVFLSVNRDEAKSTVYLDDIRSNDARSRRALLNAQSDLAFADGRLLFVRGQTLMAWSIDPATLRPTGEAVPVADPIDRGTNAGEYLFSVAQNGMLAFASGVVGVDTTLTWFDRDGRTAGTVGPRGDVERLRISPDGSAVAVDRRDHQTGRRDIWIYVERRETATRLTFNSRDNSNPVWSPDGSRLAFVTVDQGGLRIYQQPISGTTEPEPLDPLPGATQTADWSMDGRYIVANVQRGTTNWDVWMLPVRTTPGEAAKPFVVADTTAPERFPRLSPDGRWLAYQADVLGNGNDVYVQSSTTRSGRRQVSNGGGRLPVWSRDGKQLFYVANGKMWVVDVNSQAAGLGIGSARPLFDVSMMAAPSSFDVGPDGRFLIPIAAQSSGTPITIIEDWTATLNK